MKVVLLLKLYMEVVDFASMLFCFQNRNPIELFQL